MKKKEFDKIEKDIKELIKYCETKLWNLHKEEQHWRKDNQKELKRLQRKSFGWTQQIGKMIFISAILREFFDRPKVPNKVWKERRWKLDKKGNHIIEDYGKRKKTKKST